MVQDLLGGRPNIPRTRHPGAAHDLDRVDLYVSLPGLHDAALPLGGAEQLRFYADVLGLLETTTDREVGYEDGQPLEQRDPHLTVSVGEELDDGGHHLQRGGGASE